jgi:hypothetical protein
MGNNPLLHYRIICGFLAFTVCAAFGLRLLYRGLCGDVNDSSGTPIAGRGWFMVGGILCVLPLMAYAVFVWKQGYFGR